MNGDSSKAKIKDRFIRWQTVLRDQLSFLNNLLLTISIGIIGFCVSLLGQENFNPFCYTKFLFTHGLGITFISILLGLFTAWNRLEDFRATVDKINSEDSATSIDLKKKKEKMKLFGDRTWCLLHLQIITFGIGVFLLLLAFSRIYYDKLF